jgi:hypothetical protein
VERHLIARAGHLRRRIAAGRLLRDDQLARLAAPPREPQRKNRRPGDADDPAERDRRRCAVSVANDVRPRSAEDPVRRKTSHDSATDCIHVPVSEISWPLKKSW